MAAQEAGPLRMMATLGAAGLSSGAAIVGIFLATEATIAQNRAEELEAAIYEVVPKATSRATFVLENGALTEWVATDGSVPPAEDAVYGAYDDEGTFLGFAVPAEGGGFQDTIQLIYGVDPETKVLLGMRVLRSLETPGLGDKIVKSDAFVSSFEGVAAEPVIKPVKPGTSSAANEVDTISGATISSKAVIKIINQGNERWLTKLPAKPTRAEGT